MLSRKSPWSIGPGSNWMRLSIPWGNKRSRMGTFPSGQSWIVSPGITQQDNKANVQNSLVEREKELRGVAAEYGAVVRSLGELGDADGWDDAVASSYQKLSAAYSICWTIVTRLSGSSCKLESLLAIRNCSNPWSETGSMFSGRFYARKLTC
jgi:hypothetical protein